MDTYCRICDAHITLRENFNKLDAGGGICNKCYNTTYERQKKVAGSVSGDLIKFAVGSFSLFVDGLFVNGYSTISGAKQAATRYGYCRGAKWEKQKRMNIKKEY